MSTDLNVFKLNPSEIKHEIDYPLSKPLNKTNKAHICDLCGGKYSYNNFSKHKKTKIHALYDKLNTKFIQVLKMYQ